MRLAVEVYVDTADRGAGGSDSGCGMGSVIGC
jgi:hypothetical protein